MRLVGLLAWYDEPVELLDLAVRSAVHAGCKALVALDGPYSTFATTPASPPEQTAAIQRASGSIGLVLAAQPLPWRDEMEKRTALFRIGEQLTADDDWYYVVDADSEIRCDPADLHRVLLTTDADACSVPLIENGRKTLDFRCFYRAKRGIVVTENHFTYVAADGTVLWGLEGSCVDALDLTGVAEVIHRPRSRPQARLDAKDSYYRMRDLSGGEAGKCARCDLQGECLMPDKIREEPDGHVTAIMVPSCTAHARWLARRNLLIANRLGVDPKFLATPRNPTAAFLGDLAATGTRHGIKLSPYGERLSDAVETMTP